MLFFPGQVLFFFSIMFIFRYNVKFKIQKWSCQVEAHCVMFSFYEGK